MRNALVVVGLSLGTCLLAIGDEKPSAIIRKISPAPASSVRAKQPAVLAAPSPQVVPAPDRFPVPSGATDETGVDDLSGYAVYFKRKSEVAAPSELRAAHATLPKGARVRVFNVANGRSVLVTITDRITADPSRVISVSQEAAQQLGFVANGRAPVRLELVMADRGA